VSPEKEVARIANRKRRVLWGGFLAVFLPLTVLMIVQYLWLADLERTSAAARQQSLAKFLDSIAKEVSYFYYNAAEKALNVDPELLSEEKIHKAGYYYKKKKVAGVKEFFVVNYNDEAGRLYTYCPTTSEMEKPDDESSRSVRAIWAAMAPWSVVIKKGGEIDTSRFSVDQRDPQNPIVIYPITEEWKGEEKVLGLAGLILDPVFFQEKVLPKAIEASLPSDFRRDYVVTVRDAAEQLVWPSDVLEEGDDEAWRTLSFVFTDWSIGLRARHQTSEQLAKANFAYNITLSLVLGLVLMAGIVWALRTASTEMKLSEMKSDFVSNVSHELRTPISSIRVFGEFMRLGRVNDPAKVQEYGEYIETESRRLTQLINNILDFSKIESGRKQYQFEETDLEEVVEGALKIFDVRLQHSGFKIDYRGPVADLPRLQVDPGAIGQAICNLLDNAVKYSGDEREIRVSLGRSNGSVAIAVSDHGIGISEEEQQHIFDRFHRVSTGLVHDVKGSGLGLSIVQHVVQAHGGRISVESEEGHGSKFTIYLPIEGDRSTTDKQAVGTGESDLGWQRP
jgi:signal transduction histidine kinase